MFINFIHHFWPALLTRNEFLEEFVTPIVKASKGTQKISFYTIPEYEKWKANLDEPARYSCIMQNNITHPLILSISKWKVKYYKGLGTNTTEEAKEYFRNLHNHRITFTWIGDRDGEDICIFNTKLIDGCSFTI